MINKNSPIPIYYQLEEEIRTLIKQELNPGDLLPSEREYAEKYDISRMTVRQAINNLVKEGLIYRQKGRGTFIAEKKFEQDLSGLSSFSEDMRNRGLTPSNKLLSFQIMADNPRAASILKVEPNDELYVIKRLRLANEEPIALETIFTPKKLVGELSLDHFNVSFYDYIENTLNLSIAYGEQTIEAALAKTEEARELNIPRGKPVLVMERTSYLKDEQQTPIEYVNSIYRSDKYKFKMQMKREQD
ncbi:GntR family transcriptional regulator [Oceanobacillus piezotolerans]|uniref:GntR family transcriptional regulator n=1 Tax=Oceanobacillus piezotolerans TaxID=2448030 RepID=A0A498D9L5_9BACI|nr:GntR family transcriptional regulator [Oceanobacillus piezotolerans]RLL41116.1 GntR family transcriptional regulator [Oceanobacillus piezotolerans]